MPLIMELPYNSKNHTPKKGYSVSVEYGSANFITDSNNPRFIGIITEVKNQGCVKVAVYPNPAFRQVTPQ